jgi:hypothetical protein
MNTTRKGKIGRLPRQIRHDLNSRIDNGLPAADLIQWINGLDEVKDVLSKEFESRPITEQNLSDWKQAGFADWQRQQEARDRLNRFVELSQDLDDSASEPEDISARLARLLAIELAAETQRLLEETTDPKERFRCICEAIGQLNALRKADQAAARAARESQTWEEEREQRELDAIEADHQLEVQKMKARATSHIWDQVTRSSLVEAFGGGEDAKLAAEQIIDVARIAREEDPLPPLPRKSRKPRNPQPNPDKSREIQANPT